MPPVRSPVGQHVLVELGGCDPALLDDAERLRAELAAALRGAGATVLQVVAEQFTPQGVTVVALLAESHASLHSWPELGVAHVDVFTCGDAADPVVATELLAAALQATTTHREVVARGHRSVVEPISPGLTRRWELGAVRHAARTPYQRMLIAETAQGVTLFCDDERQSAEATQLVYHEALFLPAAALAARVQRVLVIGSSEGVVSQLAVGAGATVDHVDIDAECVRACATHLPYGYTSDELAAAERHEGPVHLTYGDGAVFVQDTRQRYDVVVVDLPDERPDDPDAQLNRLYATPFLKRCAELLTDGGVVVSQAGSPAVWRDTTLLASWQRFREVFAQVVPYISDEHEWAFLIGRRHAGSDPAAEMIARLPGIAAAPVSVDADSLRSRTVATTRMRR